MVEQAEEALLAEGFRQVRVRHYGDTASIEVPTIDIPSLLKKTLFEKISRHLKTIGFKYVKVDPKGYRSGSLNETLSLNVKQSFENKKKVAG